MCGVSEKLPIAPDKVQKTIQSKLSARARVDKFRWKLKKHLAFRKGVFCFVTIDLLYKHQK